jgi:Helix-turn-helix domain
MKKLHENESKGIAELTALQERAIQALLAGASVREAAKNVHVGRTTLYRWLSNGAFRAAYHSAQERSRAWTVNRLQNLTAKAVQVLEQILDDREAPTLAKIEAARAVLNFALSGKEHANQRGSLGPLKSDPSLTALHLEPMLHEGKVTVFEQATHK